MDKKELIEELISEDWRQIRVDGMLVEKRIEYEMILDQLINSTKDECAKICDKNHIQIITEKSLDKRFVQTMNPINAYNKANKDNAKAIRDKE